MSETTPNEPNPEEQEQEDLSAPGEQPPEGVTVVGEGEPPNEGDDTAE